MKRVRIRLRLQEEAEAQKRRLVREIAQRASQELGATVDFEILRRSRSATWGQIHIEFVVPPGVDPGRARRVLQRLATLAAQGRLLPQEKERDEKKTKEEGEAGKETPNPRRGAGSERRAEGAGGDQGSPSEEADRPRGVSPDDRARSGQGEKEIASSPGIPDREEGEGGEPSGGDGGGGAGGSSTGFQGSRGDGEGGEPAGGDGGGGAGGSSTGSPAGSREGQGDGEGWMDMAPSPEGGDGPYGAVGSAPALGAPPARILTERGWAVPERAGEILELLRRILGPATHLQGWAEEEPGGRWDPKRVALRVAGWLRPLRQEDRRREVGQVRLLLAPDVSPSMGPAGQAGLALAATAAEVLPDSVIVVVHDNGAPDEVWIPPDPPFRAEVDWRDPEAILSFWERMVREERVSAAILVADIQGEEAFRLLARMGVRLFWLDPHGCRAYGLRFPKKFPIGLLNEEAIEEWRSLGGRVRYAAGCGDLETMILALRRLVG